MTMLKLSRDGDAIKMEEVDCKGLRDYYKEIECRCIDIVETKVGEKYYDVIVDDEFLLKDNPQMILLTSNDDRLCGSVLISKSNAEGETISLDKKDVAYLKSQIINVANKFFII